MTPTILVVVLGFVAFSQWGQIKHIEYEVGNLEIRTINLKIVDKSENLIPEANISVEPQYSFDEIKPKYQITVVGVGRVRLAVAFSGEFILKVGAPGYNTKTIEYKDQSSTEMTITLNQ